MARVIVKRFMARASDRSTRAAAQRLNADARVKVTRAGLLLGETVLPLHAGAMHYWRHAREDWGPALDAIRAMGLKLVDVYVPWGVHETAPREFDFGERQARLDVAQFLREIHARGLYAVLRPGPHINAELTYFGLPERIVWNKECQARTPKGNPVVLPMLPVSFPVPSYASDVFFDETAQWFEAVGKAVGGLRYPQGPIVLVQIDNEGALYFRDGAYDQDYHPDAIRLYRDFLRSKYTSLRTLRDAWDDDGVSFASAEAPLRFDAREADDLARHLDWVEFHEHLLTTAMDRFARMLKGAGLDGVPTFHNLPLGEAATALNPSRIGTVLDFVGIDLYHPANPQHHAQIMRRTSELAVRSEGHGVPAYGAEVGAGFPPFFAPLDSLDSLYTLMCALAYGLNGFNLYMAVDRDRWLGAPIDPHGTPRPLSDQYRALIEALTRLEVHTLVRDTPVRLVVPRVLRRLGRAAHAFGPITPVMFNVLGAGMQESAFEEDLGMGEVATMAAETYLRTFERALSARGVPFAYAGGDGFEASTKEAKWLICATSGGVKPELFERFVDASRRGVLVTMGPHVPTRDGSLRKLKSPLGVEGIAVEPLATATQADTLVAQYIDQLSLPTFTVDRADVHVAVHGNAKGARVLWVMNPLRERVSVRVSVPPALKLTDAIVFGPRAGEQIEADSGAFSIDMTERSVRLFEITT